MSDRLAFIILWSFNCALALVVASGCATIPEPPFKKFAFPKNAFVGDVPRPYTVLGPVRAKVDYQTLDFNREEKDLCRNYYNKAVKELVRFARKQGGEAVVDVKSVVFLVDGRTETYPDAECSDEGGEGQILTQGIAVKWKGGPVESGAWVPPRVPGSARRAPSPVLPGPVVVQPPLAVAPQAPAAPARLQSFPEGATLAPDPGDAPATIPMTAAVTAVPASAAAVAPAEPAPVTAQMEPYNPGKSLMSAPAPQAQAAESPRQPATQTITFPAAPAPQQPAPSAPARRMRFNDPRAVPGTFQPAFP